MKVLVADDSKTMVRIIVNNLMKIKIKKEDILVAYDGREALEIFEANKDDLDIILTDWNMPEMTGLELVKAVREIDTDIPIVMITTEGGKASVVEALQAGVNNYVVKPFTPHTLKVKLGEFFNNI